MLPYPVPEWILKKWGQDLCSLSATTQSLLLSWCFCLMGLSWPQTYENRSQWWWGMRKWGEWSHHYIGNDRCDEQWQSCKAGSIEDDDEVRFPLRVVYSGNALRINGVREGKQQRILLSKDVVSSGTEQEPDPMRCWTELSSRIIHLWW